jgi:hypothetical protein
MASREHLVAEQRTDKNGITRTRWVKSAQSVAAGSKKMPSPKLGASVPKTWTPKEASLIISYAVADTQGGGWADGLFVAKMEEFMRSASTPEEEATLNECVNVLKSESKDPATLREQRVIVDLLSNWDIKGFYPDIHDLLRIREAFCSEWSQQNNPPLTYAKDFISGMPVNRGDRRPLDIDVWQAGFIGTIRFAYELKSRFPDASFLPTKTRDTTALDTDGYLSFTKREEYVNPELGNLVWNYRDRIGDLIEVAAEHQTNDHIRLYQLMEHKGATALVDGFL